MRSPLFPIISIAFITAFTFCCYLCSAQQPLPKLPKPLDFREAAEHAFAADLQHAFANQPLRPVHYVATVKKWASKDFVYFNDALSFINGLNDEQRTAAYIIAMNSARSGVFNGYYIAIFPEK